MTTIYSPADKGFDDRLATIDRCQVALLREIAGHYGARLTLKGGMAMRAVVGSMRLTKDIDFDRDENLSLQSVKTGLVKHLRSAASNAGIRQPSADITKLTNSTVRARLVGTSVQGVELRFEVEVSGRGAAAAHHRRTETVVPPQSYGMAPFMVEAYTHEMLAAQKIAAAMSEARNAPRDIYDLNDLALGGVNPAAILSSLPVEVLQRTRDGALGKLALISFDLAREELLPYLPIDIRSALDANRWDESTLQVGAAIERWATEALELQAKAGGI